METLNRLLASALDALTNGDKELAEKEFAKAVSACVDAYGEVRCTGRNMRGPITCKGTLTLMKYTWPRKVRPSVPVLLMQNG